MVLTNLLHTQFEAQEGKACTALIALQHEPPADPCKFVQVKLTLAIGQAVDESSSCQLNIQYEKVTTTACGLMH